LQISREKEQGQKNSPKFYYNYLFTLLLVFGPGFGLGFGHGFWILDREKLEEFYNLI
jgi:hypothetical protein